MSPCLKQTRTHFAIQLHDHSPSSASTADATVASKPIGIEQKKKTEDNPPEGPTEGGKRSILATNAIVFALLFLVFNSLDSFKLSLPNSVLFLFAIGAIFYSISAC
ncbi:hypothetical protein PanWU01x14_224270 [Parasponia andersonii]|uniref:Transmembrane protein n=1 Tax=Parasponia andersonii TaxID=3476 RepID=A0A2P5BN64_PARAD|nr:hypothetical protein PanWU01x14_224270 [Parasponia andersonii]